MKNTCRHSGRPQTTKRSESTSRAPTLGNWTGPRGRATNYLVGHVPCIDTRGSELRTPGPSSLREPAPLANPPGPPPRLFRSSCRRLLVQIYADRDDRQQGLQALENQQRCGCRGFRRVDAPVAEGDLAVAGGEASRARDEAPGVDDRFAAIVGRGASSPAPAGPVMNPPGGHAKILYVCSGLSSPRSRNPVLSRRGMHGLCRPNIYSITTGNYS